MPIHTATNSGSRPASRRQGCPRPSNARSLPSAHRLRYPSPDVAHDVCPAAQATPTFSRCMTCIHHLYTPSHSEGRACATSCMQGQRAHKAQHAAQGSFEGAWPAGQHTAGEAFAAIAGVDRVRRAERHARHVVLRRPIRPAARRKVGPRAAHLAHAWMCVTGLIRFIYTSASRPCTGHASHVTHWSRKTFMGLYESALMAAHVLYSDHQSNCLTAWVLQCAGSCGTCLAPRPDRPAAGVPMTMRPCSLLKAHHATRIITHRLAARRRSASGAR